MITIILSLVTILYLMASCVYAYNGVYAMALVFIAYAVANVGLWQAGNLH